MAGRKLQELELSEEGVLVLSIYRKVNKKEMFLYLILTNNFPIATFRWSAV